LGLDTNPPVALPPVALPYFCTADAVAALASSVVFVPVEALAVGVCALAAAISAPDGPESLFSL